MIIKGLSYLVFSTVLLTPTVALSRSEGSMPSVWEDSTAGKCYASIEEFNKTNYGDDYLNDDNIQKIAVKKSNKKLYWVLDKTPGVNITRTLIHIKSKEMACAILHAPFSSDISFKLTQSGSLPLTARSKNSPSPGFPTTTVTYKINRSTGIYKPVECQSKMPGKRAIKINCNNAFSE
jgi:hypothetical protein